MPDYYGILGVNPDATLAEIKAAFRKKVMVCHPDRGGTHEQMVQVNEAWEILSNPETRADYDAARGNQSDSAAHERAAEQSARAHQHAQRYPKSWDDMNAWLDDLVQDFAETTYEKGSVYGFGASVPSRNSRTGSWFVLAGIMFGVVYGQLFLSPPIPPDIPSPGGQLTSRATHVFVVPWKTGRTWRIFAIEDIRDRCVLLQSAFHPDRWHRRYAWRRHSSRVPVLGACDPRSAGQASPAVPGLGGDDIRRNVGGIQQDDRHMPERGLRSTATSSSRRSRTGSSLSQVRNAVYAEPAAPIVAH